MAASPPYAVFGAAPPLETLAEDVQPCFGPAPPAGCDALIGNYTMPGTFCAMPQYAQTSYCACVNNAQACPMLNAAACANSPYAYQPASMRAPGGVEYAACKGATFCVNLAEALGSGDVISNINQQCGPGTVLSAALRLHPRLAALAFVLLVALAYALAGGWDAGAGGAPAAPPPRAGEFGAPPGGR